MTQPIPDEHYLLRKTTADFPTGCTVERKPGIPSTVTTGCATAVVNRVVTVGIHRDVVLKVGDGFNAQYLDPVCYNRVA